MDKGGVVQDTTSAAPLGAGVDKQGDNARANVIINGGQTGVQFGPFPTPRLDCPIGAQQVKNKPGK